MKKIFITLFSISILAWSVNVHAVWYQVELIVFENLYPEADGELWYKTPGLVGLDDSVALKPLHEALSELSDEQKSNDDVNSLLMPYTLLPDENFRLNGIYRVLRLSREYRPLYHISWQQPGFDGDRARLVHLQSEDVTNLFELTMPASLVTDPMPTDFYEPVKLSMDGTIKIRSNLYLYVDLDMVLFRPPPVQDIDNVKAIDKSALSLEKVPEIEPVEYVRMVETRRIKLNELHYFDHPLFGVIIQVSRYGPE